MCELMLLDSHDGPQDWKQYYVDLYETQLQKFKKKSDGKMKKRVKK